MPPEIVKWLASHDIGQIASIEELHTRKGCDYGRFLLSTGRMVFMKHSRNYPDDMFMAEAEGLQALGSVAGVRVPEVLHAGPNFILMEDVGEGDYSAEPFQEAMGRMLAALHAQEQECFGWHINTYCGPTLQINDKSSNGHEFFAEHRLIRLAALAFDEGLLNRTLVVQIERIAARLPELIPTQPPVLMHGDFWTGNAHCGANDEPVMIDPACYWGWAEADLAMSVMFSINFDTFLRSYAEHHPLDKNWEERAALYNLYHWLNHVLLFGERYYNEVVQTCRRYAGERR